MPAPYLSPTHLRPGTRLILQDFASEGLRTLMVAYRELDKAFFQTWIKKHAEAWLTLENRERKLALVYKEIERDLVVSVKKAEMVGRAASGLSRL